MNPFLQNFKLSVIKVNTVYYETKTSDISDGFVGKYKKVEESFLAEKQSKTYVYEIPYIENILFKTMSSCARDLLLYIIYNLPKDQDFINLKTEKVLSILNISKPTLIKAKNQLEESAIICSKSQSEYWINPFYLFNGNRIDYYNKQCPDCINQVAEVVKR